MQVSLVLCALLVSAYAADFGEYAQLHMAQSQPQHGCASSAVMMQAGSHISASQGLRRMTRPELGLSFNLHNILSSAG
jgi:hypothetical protein